MMIMQADLRTKFQTTVCPPEENVRTHPDRMRALHEDLASACVGVDDGKYASIVIRRFLYITKTFLRRLLPPLS